MAHIGREVNDLQQALGDLLDRWPRAKAASLDPEAQRVLARADALLEDIDALTRLDTETPGERASGARRPSRRERARSQPPRPGSWEANARRLGEATRRHEAARRGR
jgi:hypothetical protein